MTLHIIIRQLIKLAPGPGSYSVKHETINRATLYHSDVWLITSRLDTTLQDLEKDVGFYKMA